MSGMFLCQSRHAISKGCEVSSNLSTLALMIVFVTRKGKS